MSSEAKIASMKELETALENIPPVQVVLPGCCGVRYVRRGIEVACCRPGKKEFTTLSSDAMDNKTYQPPKCQHHRNCCDKQYSV